MSKRLDEGLGAFAPDGLIVANEPAADVATVSLAASQGVLTRGTVVTGTPGGELSAAAAALTAANGTYILADDTDITATTVATAYRTGHFARNKLTTDGSYTLVAADEEIMRNAGILLSDALEY